LVDKRRDERFESDLKIKLEQGEGVLRNVSASGVYFVTDVDLEPSTPVSFSLEFNAPQTGAIEARCLARIVRVEQQGSLKGVAALFDSIEFHRIPKAPDA
jgi:hypothetical protein